MHRFGIHHSGWGGGIEYGFDSCGIREVEELISQNPHLAAYGAREEGGTVRH